MSARRTKVAKHPGVYYRETSHGRRYEITWLDELGVRRWRTVAGGLREADAALTEVKGKLGRGERVSASRVRLAEFAEEWLASRDDLRGRTRETYEQHLRVHALPRLGRMLLREIREDDVARLVREMRAADCSPWTIRATLTPLSALLNRAVRRGVIASNPVARLERSERPATVAKEKRILSTGEVRRLLDAAPVRYRTLIATAIYSGMRMGELLGLTWADVDFDGGFLRVRRQLDRHTRSRVEPKTPQAVREIVLLPALAMLLRQHREEAFGRGLARPSDLVFASETGTALNERNVSQRGLEKAAKLAGLDEPGKPRLTMHSLRHAFASHLILDLKLDVVQVSRLLGHARPSITSDVYASLFDQARHADDIRARLAASEFGQALNPSLSRPQRAR